MVTDEVENLSDEHSREGGGLIP